MEITKVSKPTKKREYDVIVTDGELEYEVTVTCNEINGNVVLQRIKHDCGSIPKEANRKLKAIIINHFNKLKI